MKTSTAVLPPLLVLDPLLKSWLLEDIGRGDRTTQSLLTDGTRSKDATWTAKEPGVVAVSVG
jgi:nicotinate-nucleotide pyrophosphorylase (carboxylating)